MSAEAEPEQANEELVKQDSNMWEFEGAPEGEDAESPATNGQSEVKVEDKDGDMAMGDAAAANANSKHAPIPTPGKAGEMAKSGMPAQAQQAKQAGPKFGSGVNQGKAFEGRRQHRYFVLKSKSMFNVDQSVEKGIWATQVCRCIPSMATRQLSHHMAMSCRQYSVCFSVCRPESARFNLRQGFALHRIGCAKGCCFIIPSDNKDSLLNVWGTAFLPFSTMLSSTPALDGQRGCTQTALCWTSALTVTAREWLECP